MTEYCLYDYDIPNVRKTKPLSIDTIRVMRTVMKLGNRASAVDVSPHVKIRRENVAQILVRMEQRGFVTSELKRPAKMRGRDGRTPRLFSVTKAGQDLVLSYAKEIAPEVTAA